MSQSVTAQNNIAALASRFINHTNRNIFLTGKAGTGKTTFLKYIKNHTHKNVVIAAPTGIAAINAGGVTLHSLFHLPFGAFIPESKPFSQHHLNSKINDPVSLMKHMRFNTNKRKLLQELELLIIDEVSMLRPDILDAVDTVLRSVRKKPYPFGGVQILFIGDLLQLPPVIKDDEWQVLRDHYNSPFFFDAQVLRNEQPVYIELEKIYRQQDTIFIDLLNNLRNNEVTQQDVELLNSYYKPHFQSPEGENYIYLTTHNYKADKVNKEELAKLKEKSYFFHASVSGDFNEYAYPVEQELELKQGAQVMFIKNDPSGEQKFFNGKIGKIKHLDRETVEVEFDDDAEPVVVEQYTWENVQYKLNEATNEIEEKVAGTFRHLPLKLAWAITVHKSQGLTFDKAIIDTGQAFAPGQVYVALSRLTSLDGLVLSSPINYSSLRNNHSVTAFAEMKYQQRSLEDQLETEAVGYMKDFIINCFNFIHINEQLQKHISTYTKNENLSAKQKHLQWALQLKNEFEPNILTSEKFRQQLQRIMAAHTSELQLLHERIIAAKDYYTPILKKVSEQIFEQIENAKKESKTSKYVTELKELEAIFFKQLQQINKATALVRSAIDKEELTENNSEILTKKEKKERAVQLEQANIKKGKKPKGASQEESYQLLMQGKSIEEIAKERGMAVTTIEGHLAECVKEGKLEVHDFVAMEQLDKIFAAIIELQTTTFSPIKEKLGDTVTYKEIKFAVAAYLRE